MRTKNMNTRHHLLRYTEKEKDMDIKYINSE